jgi:hypothetical protein
MNMSVVPTPDPWNIGTLHKGGIWIFYSMSNYLGVVLCLFLMYSVYRNKNRIASDVFVAGLAFACARMSFTCGVQCSVSFAAGRFYGGEAACKAEAIAHVSAILEEFFCVTCLFLNMYFRVVRGRVLKTKYALGIVAMIFVICLIITGLASLSSPIYLMSAGTYCFFAFSSFAIAGWLVPGLVFALVTSFTCNFLILRHFKRGTAQLPKEEAQRPNMTVWQQQPAAAPPSCAKTNSGTAIGVTDGFLGIGDILKTQFKWRSTLFIIGLLVGWGSAAITTIYEFAVGRASEGLVTAVGVGGVSFSWWAPVIYSFTSKHYKNLMLNVLRFLFAPCLERKLWWQMSVVRLSGSANDLERGSRGEKPEDRHNSSLGATLAIPGAKHSFTPGPPDPGGGGGRKSSQTMLSGLEMASLRKSSFPSNLHSTTRSPEEKQTTTERDTSSEAPPALQRIGGCGGDGATIRCSPPSPPLSQTDQTTSPVTLPVFYAPSPDGMFGGDSDDAHTACGEAEWHVVRPEDLYYTSAADVLS